MPGSSKGVGKGGRGLGKGKVESGRRRYKGTPVSIALHAKLKAAADAAEKEKKRKEETVMELTEEMKAAVQRAFEVATAPERLAQIERVGQNPECRAFTVYTCERRADGLVEALWTLNQKTWSIACQDLLEQIREHFAPFQVFFENGDRFTVRW